MLKSVWRSYSYVILLMIMVLFMSLVALMKAETAASYNEITVKEGDSLWSIAERISESHNLSTKEVVELLADKNNLTTDIIKPGDSLVIPLEEPVLMEKDNYELAGGTE